MTRIRSRRTPRYAFTLIELLVVIAIIAVLVSLSAAGIMKILDYVPQVQTSTDIGQMEGGLGSFMAEYQLQDPPPSYLILKEDLQYDVTKPVELRSKQFLLRLFGKNLGAGTASIKTGGLPWIDWNGDGVFDKTTLTFNGWNLEGEQCLVFYLGGIPNTAARSGGAAPQCLGFSTNAANPAAATTSRKGPYFNFVSTRLVAGTGGFFVYLDAWKPSTGTQLPYAYFSSYGVNNGYSITDCKTIGASPYWTAQTMSGVPTQFTNPNKYQIISAGKDGVFGGGLWVPSSGAIGNGRDDQANFSSKVLGAGQS